VLLQPEEVSLAHQGILLLDERPECKHHVLEVLRQLLEDGITRIQSRGRPLPDSAGGVSYAAAPLHRRSDMTGGRDDREGHSCQAVYQARPHP
jgi:Magnesium chelatase, subunit ChlI